MEYPDQPWEDDPLSREAIQRKALPLLTKAFESEFPMTAVYAQACHIALLDKEVSSSPRRLVDVLVNMSSRSQLARLRSGLLKFFVADGDPQEAARYLPKRGREHESELHPVMACSLLARNQSTARRIYNTCMEYYPDGVTGDDLAKTEFVFYELASAVAIYHAHAGKTSIAIEYWEMASKSDRLFVEARSDIVSAQLVEGLASVQMNLRMLLEKQAGLPLSSRGIESSDSTWQLDGAIHRLREVEAELINWLPYSSRYKFNLDMRLLNGLDDGKERL